MEKIIAILFWIILACVLGLGVESCYKSTIAKKDAAQTLMNEFRNAPIIAIYSYRTGTKNANYHYKNDAVLENENGKRLRVSVGVKNPLVGEIWSLKYNRYGRTPETSIFLDRRIR